MDKPVPLTPDEFAELTRSVLQKEREARILALALPKKIRWNSHSGLDHSLIVLAVMNNPFEDGVSLF